MTEEYLSKNRDHINRLQRARRASLIRIDYADVSPEAAEIIASLRQKRVGGDHSSILNRIVTEWAELRSGTKD